MGARDVLRLLQRVVGSAWTSKRVQRSLAQVPRELKRLDAELIETELVQPPTCRGRGCSACCRSDVPVFAHELPGLLAAVTPAMADRVRTRRHELVPKARGVDCPALEPDGSCAIYAARPAVCRAYAVVSPPEWCDVSLSGVRDVATPTSRFMLVGALGKRLGASDTVSWYGALVEVFGVAS